MSDTHMTHDTELRRYVWHGGAYIDVGPRPHDGEFQALDVLNVWDYAKGEPTIARTLDAFKLRCERADLEFDAQSIAEEINNDELSGMLYDAEATEIAAFELISDRADDLYFEGEIACDEMEQLNELRDRARRVNAL